MHGKFSDIPYFLITTYFSTLAYIDRFSRNQHSMLIGPRTSIVTKGAPVQEMFVKDQSFGYRPVWLTPVSTQENEFYSVKSNIITTPSENYVEISGDSYYFRVYDTSKEEDFIEDGDEIYFRKDSPFYEWISKNANSFFEDIYKKEFILRNYVNTDNDFIYFGKIYGKSFQEDLYMIEFYNSKDFIVDLVPTHQQTDRFKEFLSLYGDMVFNETYSLQKNIFSAIDPFTIDEKYLNHLSSIAGISIDDLDLNILNKRTLVHELINLLKSKGSFIALRYLWKLVTNNTLNNINFYEIWHDKNIDGYVDLLERKELPWHGYYGVQREDLDEYYALWVDKYHNYEYPKNLDEITLATQYKVEVDLTREPIHNFQIFNETLANRIYDYWEIFRPINRVADYNIFVSPITDLTTRWISLYNTEKEAFMLSKSYLSNVSAPNTSIRVFRVDASGDFEYIIEHGLNTRHVLIQVYSFDLRLVVPEEIEYLDNNRLKIRLKNAQTVFALLRRPRFSAIRPWGTMDSGLNTKYYISDFIESKDFTVPDEFEVIDEFNYNITPMNAIEGVFSKYSTVFLREIPSTTWFINHDVSGEFFIHAYDLSNKKIYPKSIYMVSSTQVIVEYEHPTSGYAILTNSNDSLTFYSLGTTIDWEIEHNFDAKFINVQVYDLNNEVIVPKDIIYLSDNRLRITLEEPEEIFAVLKIADNNPSEYLWTITHNINRQEVLTQFTNDNKQLVPDGVLLSDVNEVKTTVSGGVSLISNYDYLHNQPTNESEWLVTHNFGHAGCLVNVYDMDNNKLYPKEIRLINDFSLKIIFDEPKSGYAVLVSIGSVYFSEIVKLTTVRFSNEDRSQVYENAITETWDNDDYIYFRLYIPKGVELSINRIELITYNDEVFFETQCSEIFKSKHFSMDTFYRIFKGVL